MDSLGSSKRQKINYEVSEAEILELVARREAARQARRFEESDAIRQELRDKGVELYDKDKEWKSKDGRRGSLFTAGAMECILTDTEIMDQITQREDARKSKDFDTADRIREALRQMGVELNDREAVWRTSTGRAGTYTGTPMVPQSGGTLTGAAIRKLVAERERMRSVQDFEGADELRRQLAQLGVELFEQEVPRLWKTADGMLGAIFPGPEVPCNLTDREIQAKVDRREEARSKKQFSEADAIRTELRSHGIELLDNQKEWCTTDGRHGAYSGGSVNPFGGGGGGCGGGGGGGYTPAAQAISGGFDPLAGLAQMLAAAVPGADVSRIATGLQQMVGSGGPSNAAQQAQKANAGAAAKTSNPSAGSLTDASIMALVAGRERARDLRDWQAADAIRQDLRSHGVDVWDNEKVWRSNDGRAGPIIRNSGV